MHYTLRVKLDAGTPTDRIEGAHVYLELETLDDLTGALEQLTDAYDHALDEGIGTAFLDQHVQRALTDEPLDEPATYYDPPESLAGTVFDPTSPTFGPIMAALQAGDFETAMQRLATLTRTTKGGPA